MISKVVIHCSDSPHGRDDDAKTIHQWHTMRGWSGIGYHYVITEAGDIQTGRPEYWDGAHVKNHNTGSIGICLIGRNVFKDQQMGALVDLHKDISERYPNAQWFNHYDLDPSKTCPNFDAAGILTGRK